LFGIYPFDVTITNTEVKTDNIIKTQKDNGPQILCSRRRPLPPHPTQLKQKQEISRYIVYHTPRQKYTVR